MLWIAAVVGAMLGILAVFYKRAIFVAALLILLAGGSVFFCNRVEKRKVLLAVLVFAIAFVAFFSKAVFDEKKYIKAAQYIYPYTQTQAQLDAVVLRTENRLKNTHIYARVKDQADILIVTKNKAAAEYKDEIHFACKLKYPSKFQTQYGVFFDYAQFLKTRHTVAVCYYPKGLKITTPSLSLPEQLLRRAQKLKQLFLQAQERLLSQQSFALLSGIMLGEKGKLSQVEKNYFQNSGLIHIVVLSGYNVMLVAVFFLAVFRLLSPFYAPLFAIAFMFLFGFLAGFDPPATRAILMASISFLALFGTNTYKARQIFFAVLLIMLFWNTNYLFDASFQFSFLATFGILYLYDYFADKFGMLPGFVKEVLSATLAVFVALGPFLAYKIGVLQYCSLPSNILVSPVLAVVMGLGVLVLLPVPGVQWLLVEVLEILLGFIYFVAHSFGGRNCFVQIHPPAWALLVYYFGLFVFVYLIQQIFKKSR